MMFPENILRLTVLVRFQKHGYFTNVNFLPNFSVNSYNNLIVTKQIYFLLTFLKSYVHIYDNIAGVVGVPQYY